MAGGVTLSVVVEADETFTALSYKGNHKRSHNFKMPRRPHKRGHGTHQQLSQSAEKVYKPQIQWRLNEIPEQLYRMAQLHQLGQGNFQGEEQDIYNICSKHSKESA